MTQETTDRPVILLVDDDAKILSLGQEILEHLGYRVLTAGEGQTAVEIFTREKPSVDLVILDYLLPSRDGYEILCELRQVDPEVQVIMASGFFSQAEMEKFRAAGAAGLIDKPFRMRGLELEIKRVLGQKV